MPQTLAPPSCAHRIERTGQRSIRRSLRAFVLLLGCLLVTAAKASTPQQMLLELTASTGTLSHLAAMHTLEAWSELRVQHDLAAEQIQRLRHPSPAGSVDASYEDRWQRMQQSWQRVSDLVNRMLDQAEIVTTAHEDAVLVSEAATPIMARTDELARRIADSIADGELIYSATRQLVLLERIQRRIRDVLRGGVTATISADGLQRDFAILSRVQKALATGDKDIGIAMLEDESARELAVEINASVQELAAPIGRVASAARSLSDVSDQTEELRLELSTFQRSVVDLQAGSR